MFSLLCSVYSGACTHTTTDIEKATTTNQLLLDQDSVLRNRNPSDAFYLSHAPEQTNETTNQPFHEHIYIFPLNMLVHPSRM